ncbi:3-deoxy-D-manno-octulosonic acid transferase [Insolitispirillum peregrinum]|uniref:3-deoxy-D-manno-octulosonic acid transferase n=1 Tax=Insolitispirillum peregrinum TaxID=80876 RepID=A0A1N7LV37_9PROT|nr:3-deoxy-D-manno-octulosonic acid transferase [Insolitispirillum peregrinum]SIS77619.1 3-deoxy-D-manno-octulosonic-acid transferase [Insolitispirillum peregrinum]
MIRRLYAALTTLAGPALHLYLRRRLKRGKEHPTRFGERLGRAGRLRPEGKLLWMHGASVGECLSVLPLIDLLLARYPDWTVMVTSGTVTSAELMMQRLPPRAFHQFVPVDRLPWVRRFLDHWRPDAVVWLESEFWPNLIHETRRRAIPMALVNGRVSDSSLRSWQRLPAFIGGMLGAFQVVLGQTDQDAARLSLLGAASARCVGNLKSAAAPLPADDEALKALRQIIGARPCWLASSTHPGEEIAVWQVHRQLQDTLPDLLTIIVPRHPQRGPEIATDLAAAGAEVSLRSTGGTPTAATSVYIADTLGELGLFYRLCPVVFVGKSLPDLPHAGGGQNPLEPARLGCSVVFGPSMGNFALLADQMTLSGAARQVADPSALAETIGWLLRDERARAVMADAGQALASAEAAVTERVVAALAPLLAGESR